jgi:uncharacterized membrane protein YfcA
MEHYMWFIPLGFVIGAYGTLIGAGGGFVLAPVLLLLHPTEAPENITSISLAVVFFNTLSGSAAYARMKRIDYKSGVVFAAATVPGAILGAFTTPYISPRLFDAILGALMIAASIFLLARPTKERKAKMSVPHFFSTRHIVEADGTAHTYSFDLKIGIGISLLVGFVSSVLGIGGGIMHVPALTTLLNFPVHVATATSHFVLMVMALTATIAHIADGTFSQTVVQRTAFLAVGVLIGAQLGARLSNRVHGVWILRGLAIALAFVGIRIIVLAL